MEYSIMWFCILIFSAILFAAAAYHYHMANKAKEVIDLLKQAKAEKERIEKWAETTRIMYENLSNNILKSQKEKDKTISLYAKEASKCEEEAKKYKEIVAKQSKELSKFNKITDSSAHYRIQTKLITITEFDENDNTDPRDIQICLTAQQYHSLCEKVCMYYEKRDNLREYFEDFLCNVFPGTYSFFKNHIQEDEEIIDYDDFSSITSYNFKFKEEDIEQMYEDYITPNKFKDFP